MLITISRTDASVHIPHTYHTHYHFHSLVLTPSSCVLCAAHAVQFLSPAGIGNREGNHTQHCGSKVRPLYVNHMQGSL